MKLYLLRHGDAGERGDPKFTNDDDRPLSSKGTQRTKLLAHALRGWKISFDVIWSSPLVRARQTADIVEHGLRLHRRLEFTSHLAPGGDAEKLVALVNGSRPRSESVLLVGHEPFLSEFISLLCTGGPQLSLTLKKGALCRLEVEKLDCSRCASLDWLLPPRLQAAKRPPRSGEN
jgi:phosphohistidine phosphatase